MTKALPLAALTGSSRAHLIEDEAFSWIHPQVSQDLHLMVNAAAKAGFTLRIYSGFRDSAAQLRIWNAKWQGLRPLLDLSSKPLDYERLSESQRLHAILRWSALPGASRHHWGTDFDLYDPNLLGEQSLQLIPQEYQHGGHQHPLAHWLEQHAAEFGFFYPYAEDRGGVAHEPWHLSHQACSEEFLAQLRVDKLAQFIGAQEIGGKSLILDELEQIYTRYISNICRAKQS